MPHAFGIYHEMANLCGVRGGKTPVPLLGMPLAPVRGHTLTVHDATMTTTNFLPTDSTTAPDSGRQGGFTLVEIITVVAMIGVITGIVLLRVDRERARVDSQVQKLAFALNAAQREAVVRQHDVRVYFDTSAGQIKIHKDENNDGTVQTSEPQSDIYLEDGVVFGLQGTDGLTWGTSPVTFDLVGGVPTLVFHRNGSASAFGAAYVSSKRPLTEYNRAIEVERATGAVRCYSYRTGSWVVTC